MRISNPKTNKTGIGRTLRQTLPAEQLRYRACSSVFAMVIVANANYQSGVLASTNAWLCRRKLRVEPFIITDITGEMLPVAINDMNITTLAKAEYVRSATQNLFRGVRKNRLSRTVIVKRHRHGLDTANEHLRSCFRVEMRRAKICLNKSTLKVKPSWSGNPEKGIALSGRVRWWAKGCSGNPQHGLNRLVMEKYGHDGVYYSDNISGESG